MTEEPGRKRHPMMVISFAVLRIIVFAYIGILLLVYFMQSKYVYYPGRNVDLTPAAEGMAYEDLRLKTEDGEVIAGWYVPATNENAAPLLIDCHGNAGDIGDRVESVKTFHRLGFNVIIFDYRGYGESTGKPFENGTYMDAMAVWKYAVNEKKFAPARTVVFGRSMGGAVATWLAERESPGVLVLESTFSSATDMGKLMFPYLPVRLLIRNKYDTLSRIPNVKCPILVAHSRDDESIPFRQAEKLFKAANEPKVFIEISGQHNDGGLDINAAYQAALVDFVSKHIANSANVTGN